MKSDSQGPGRHGILSRMIQPVESTAFQPRLALRAGLASIAVVTLLIVIKTIAYLVSFSASILASLVDSVTDAAVSVMSFMAIRESLKPPDKNHRHGHGKIEGLAAVLQGIFIAGAALFLGIEAIGRLANPQPVGAYGLGVAVMVVSIILSVLLVVYQQRIMRNAPSLAVEADRAHYASDIAINGGVIAALALQYFGAPVWVDAVFALCVAMMLSRTAFKVGRKGIDMLLDHELPKETREQIKEIILNDRRVHSVHDIRTRASGMNIHISFDIEVDDTLTLKAAHDIAVDVELELLKEFPNAEIMIHVDPLGDTYDHRHNIAGVQP